VIRTKMEAWRGRPPGILVVKTRGEGGRKVVAYNKKKTTVEKNGGAKKAFPAYEGKEKGLICGRNVGLIFE